MTFLFSEGTDCLTNELLKAFCLHNYKCLLEESIGNLNELQETELLLLFVWAFFFFVVVKVWCTAFDHLCPISNS